MDIDLAVMSGKNYKFMFGVNSPQNMPMSTGRTAAHVAESQVVDGPVYVSPSDQGFTQASVMKNGNAI